nr:PREDICTED: uncharacterized protein LOC109032028 [Bemisia tabaci]XP_018899470.1 PREDICTED: uncharacterized protein LOC109032028 [Bemisia tabaci]
MFSPVCSRLRSITSIASPYLSLIHRRNLIVSQHLNLTRNSPNLTDGRSSVYPDYLPIYWAQKVPKLGFVCKMRRYTMLYTVVVSANAFIVAAMDYWSSEIGMAALTVGGSTYLALYLASRCCHRFVGAVYLKEDGKQVVISYLDFDGNRADDTIPKSDLIPVNELARSASPFRFYRTLKRRSNDDHYKLNIRFGEVRNKEAMIYIFGSEVMH